MAYESQGGTWREMITKETFVKALQLIQEQQEINHQFAKALDPCRGWTLCVWREQQVLRCRNARPQRSGERQIRLHQLVAV